MSGPLITQLAVGTPIVNFFENYLPTAASAPFLSPLTGENKLLQWFLSSSFTQLLSGARMGQGQAPKLGQCLLTLTES